MKNYFENLTAEIADDFSKLSDNSSYQRAIRSLRENVTTIAYTLTAVLVYGCLAFLWLVMSAHAQFPQSQVYPVPLTATHFNGASGVNPNFVIVSNLASTTLNFEMQTGNPSPHADNVTSFLMFSTYSLTSGVYDLSYSYNITNGSCELGWSKLGTNASTNMDFGPAATVATLSGSGSGSSTRSISSGVGLYVRGVTSDECDGVIVIDSLTSQVTDFEGRQHNVPVFTIVNNLQGAPTPASGSGSSSDTSGIEYLLGLMVGMLLVALALFAWKPWS